MKKILFLLLISASAQAQFTRVVNGVTVSISKEDSIAIVNDIKAYEFKRFSDSVDEAKVKVLKNQIISTAQTAVGVRVDQLTAAQVRSLFAIVLFKEGAIDSALRVKPLLQWVK